MTISTGAFDSFGIPQGSRNLLDDLADVDTTEAKEGNTIQNRDGRWVAVDGNEVAISPTYPPDLGVEIWINPTEGDLSAGASVEYVWIYDAPTAMADPGSNKVRTDTASGVTPTNVAISAITKSGLDVGDTIRKFLPGDVMYFQQNDNSVNWSKFEITGAPVDNVTWFQFPISPLGTGGVPIAKSIDVLIRFTYGANSANVDPRYVAIKGDEMTGDLTLNGGGIILNNPPTSAIIVNKDTYPQIQLNKTNQPAGIATDWRIYISGNETEPNPSLGFIPRDKTGATGKTSYMHADGTMTLGAHPVGPMDAATKRSSYPGYYGWAGRAMNTDRSLAVDSNQGLVFESPYTTPPEMTPMTYSTGTIATVSGTCSLFTIPTTAYYQVNIMADVQSTVLGSETYFVFAYWTNGSATSSNIYAKQVVTTGWAARIQFIHSWTRGAGDVIGVSLRAVGSAGTWKCTYANVTIVSL